MTPTEIIISNLEAIFAPFDQKVLAGSKEWAHGRVKAIQEFKKSPEAKTLRCDTYYSRLFAIAGGKSWYNTFDGQTAAAIDIIMEKNHRSTIIKWNASIAKKLEKADVTEVIGQEFVHTNDGFNGVYIVNTNAGIKKVIIDTIYAGGYNIQCLHLRVLVKVK